MNNATDLSIHCNVGLTVTRQQAERCLRILEMYLDDNPNVTIICDTKDLCEQEHHYTKHHLYFERLKFKSL